MAVTVNLFPIPRAYLSIPKRLRPGRRPIFTGGVPSPEDIALARELFKELDPESQEWYGRKGIFADL